jgi:hypothetical protein
MSRDCTPPPCAQNTAHISILFMLQLYRGAESRVQPQGGGGGEAGHQPEELGPLLGLRLSQRCQAQTPLPYRQCCGTGTVGT